MRLDGSAPYGAPFDALDRRSPAALAAWWRGRVRAVLEVAHAELPFYRRRFERAGFDPSSFRALDDLRRVPVFSKADVLAAQRERGRYAVGLERSTAGDALVLSSSSGTRGTTFLEHPARWRRVQGRSSLRAHWWAGLRPGAPLLLSAPAWHSYAAVQTWLAESLALPCVVIAGTYLPRFAGRIADAMRGFRPRFVTMFLPMVFSLVAQARRGGGSPRELFAGVETLVVTGAPITPGMRDRVQRETGVERVVELAGSTENLLAVECSARAGLHVVPDTCYAEVLRRDSDEPVAPGERGRVVHTCVVPWGSMYLRFDGGDAGVIDASPCFCGLPSPRIKLVGRYEDAFALGGRELLPYDVQLAVEESVPELAGVPGRLDLVLARPETGLSAGAEDAVARALGARFGVTASARVASGLPLQFKGVPSVLSAAEAGQGGGA